ncbi:MAG: nascent polypeptide-associated complex protein [archaeon]|jgi:nascent polypeptide-associated complex subunit alpha
MFPGGVNPKQMNQMMKQFGIKNEEVDAKEVIIILKSGKKILFENPQVTSISMRGTKTYTIAGEEKEITGVPAEDIEMVAEQAGVLREEAKNALTETNGDIAQAILKLKEKK